MARLGPDMASDPTRGTERDRVTDPTAASRKRVPFAPASQGVGKGLDLAVELVSAIFVVGGFGWLMDRWLGTAPWGLVIGFLVGNACGLYLIALHSRPEEEVERLRQEAAARRTEKRRGKG